MAERFPLKKETHEVIGCAMEVHRAIGHGLHEKPYERALVVGLGIRSIPWQQQPSFDIEYKGHHIGKCIPDLIACGKIVVDTKTIPRIANHEIGQMMTYLRVTHLPIGFVLNFSNSSLEFRRVVLTQAQPSNQEIYLR